MNSVKAGSDNQNNIKKKANKKMAHTARIPDSFTQQGENPMLVPPGLFLKMIQFEAHVAVSRGKPIAIIGDTGVGKTLFLRIFKKLYQKQGGDEKRIYTVNCSHFDKALARSELFGHEKGSFTGADKKKVGWIAKADGGVLVLDEIGELSEDNQAKLLTVIEDGEYHTVGGTEIKKVKNLQLVGLTNQVEWAGRPDFWQRLFPFFIPPLHQRRSDVLYHLAADFPDLVSELVPSQVLSVLAYNWPGNVRELQRIELLSRRMTKYLELRPFRHMKNNPPTLPSIDKHDSALNIFTATTLYDDLEKHGIDMDSLESLLNHFCVGLRFDRKQKAFPEFHIKKVLRATSPQQYNAFFPRQFEAFKRARFGYELFCFLFFQDASANRDNLNVKEGGGLDSRISLDHLYGKLQSSFIELMNPIFEYLTGIILPKGEKVPVGLKERKTFLHKWFNLEPTNKFLSSLVGKSVVEKRDGEIKPDIFKMTETEFNKYYYDALLKRYGTVRAVAKVLNVNESTLYGRYKRVHKK